MFVVVKSGKPFLTLRIEASKRVPIRGECVSAMSVSRLASFRGGAENDDVQSLAARLFHVTDSGSGSDFAASFDSDINPSGSVQNVCV